MCENIISGKIYAIKSFQTENMYIGSTINTLKQRYKEHKSDYKRYLNGNLHYVTSCELFKFDDCYIELIKDVVCTKKQMLELEAFEIKNNMNVVNKCLSLRTLEEAKKYHKEYSKNNKYKYKDYQKKWEEEQNKIYVLCKCGENIKKRYMLRHIKTKKHKKIIYELLL